MLAALPLCMCGAAIVLDVIIGRDLMPLPPSDYAIGAHGDSKHDADGIGGCRSHP